MNFKKIWIFLKHCSMLFFSKKEQRKCGTVGSKTINVALIASKDALLFLFFFSLSLLYSRTFHSLPSFQCCFLWHTSKRIIALPATDHVFEPSPLQKLTQDPVELALQRDHERLYSCYPSTTGACQPSMRENRS